MHAHMQARSVCDLSWAGCIQGRCRWLRHPAAGNKHLPLARAPLYVLEIQITQPIHSTHHSLIHQIMCRQRLPTSSPSPPSPPINEAVHGRRLLLLLLPLLPTLRPGFNLLAWQVQLGEERNYCALLDMRNVYICAAPIAKRRSVIGPATRQMVEAKAGGSAEKKSSVSQSPPPPPPPPTIPPKELHCTKEALTPPMAEWAHSLTRLSEQIIPPNPQLRSLTPSGVRPVRDVRVSG